MQHGSANRCSQTGGVSAASPSRHTFPSNSGEGDHQLEKLEFALAVALTRGDLQRSQTLRDQIAALGGNLEEPGT
ncbi:MAG: hypothetical protein VKI39_00280 [Synechococcus sp.]|nr:hypothetical protein [Synechococcus sp.]